MRALGITGLLLLVCAGAAFALTRAPWAAAGALVGCGELVASWKLLEKADHTASCELGIPSWMLEEE